MRRKLAKRNKDKVGEGNEEKVGESKTKVGEEK